MNKFDIYTNLLISYGIKLLIAIVIIIVGRFISGKIRLLSQKAMKKSLVDEMIIKFFGDLIYYTFFIISIVVALNTMGLKTTSIAAVIGAATLAIGLSLQSNLSNLGSGVMILITKPFKISDVVEVGGILGVVDKVSIFSTTLKSFDNRVIIMPNSKVTAGEIINYSTENTRRLDITVGIGYEDDIKLAKSILVNLAENDERVLKEPAYFVGVLNLGDSSIELGLRLWVNSRDYFSVKCDMLEKIKQEFDTNKINIPYPQMDVTLKKVS